MHRLRRFAARFQSPATVDMPSTLLEGGAPRIDDGLDYAQPILLPGHLRQQLESEGRLTEWLNDQSDTREHPRGSVDTFITEDPLREWHWSTRQQVLSTCHSAYQRNPIAKRATQYVSAFVVGSGFNLTCKNKDVERVLQAFIDAPDNAIREYERQAVIDLLVDGELFLRFFQNRSEIVAVPLRPWEIQYIRTQMGYFRRPELYHWQPYAPSSGDDPTAYTAVNAEDIPAKSILHVAINRHAYELRGRPELYSALPWLRAHKEWQENRAKQNYYRGALLWWVKIMSSVPGVIAAKLAQYQRPPTPGSTVVTSDKEEWSALTNPVGAGDASEDGRQLKIMALNGIAGIPEYMTGDGENANLATSKSQQLPVLMTFSQFQTILTEQLWYPLFKRVIQVAMDAGELPAEVEEQDADGDPLHEDPPEETPTARFDPLANPTAAPTTPVKRIATLDAFDVQYEPVGDNEPFTLMQALETAMNDGILSKESATVEMGWDYAIEQKRIARERKRDLDAMQRGEAPIPPEMMPQQEEPEVVA